MDHFTGIEGYKVPGANRPQHFSNPRAFFDSWKAGEQGARLQLLEHEESNRTDMAAAVRTLRELVSRATPPVEGLDVVVDDGSHKQQYQQMNLALLFPLVAPGGVYVIEDLHASLIHGYNAQRPRPHKWSAAGSRHTPIRPVPRYDVPPGSAKTTLAMLERWNETGGSAPGGGGRISSAFIEAVDAAYLERWIDTTVPVRLWMSSLASRASGLFTPMM